MGELAEFNPMAAAKFFVDDKTRRERDVTTTSEKPKQQSYFGGILREAKQTDHYDIDDDEMSGSIFDF